MTDDIDQLDDARPLWPREYRTAETLDVRYPDRIVEVIAVPYDEETVVPYKGRAVIESFAPGAFEGSERRANRVNAYRHHDRTGHVGRCRALYPNRKEGLVAEIRIAQGPLGDETLDYCADRMLDASIEFAVGPEHQQWSEDRSRRRIVKAWLGHIALIPEPAYEGANVLAVRSVSAPSAEVVLPPVPTPNLDQVRLWQLQERYATR